MLAFHSGRGQYLFDNLRTKDGLSSREVRCVYRDREGFVWMGTSNGLNRYDGSQFRVWSRSSPGFPSNLGETINYISENKQGQIWFGTDHGAGVFDKASFSFYKLKITNADGSDGSNLSVVGIKKDGSGRLLMGSEKGVFIEMDGEFVAISSVYPFAKELDHVICYGSAMHFDSIKNVWWIGTEKNGMFRLDIKNKELQSASNNPNNYPFLNRHNINALVTDKLGNLWYSDVSEAALGSFNFETGNHHLIRNINNDPRNTLGGGCNTLFIDREGRLWISTWLYAVFIRSPDGRIEQIRYNQEYPFSIGYGFFMDAIQDEYGDIWLATINGISRYSSHRFVRNIIKSPNYPFYLSTGVANINTLAREQNGIWWLGKMEGLVRYDSTSGKFDHYIHQDTNLRWNEIRKIKLINDEVWCATGNGIQIFNDNSKKFRPLRTANRGIIPGSVMWIQPDKYGYIWFSIWQTGLYRYDPRTGECISFNEEKEKWGNYPGDFNFDFFIAGNDNYWVATGYKGLRIFNPSLGKFREPLSDQLKQDYVVSITEDASGNIWVGNNRKIIFKCDPNGRVLDSITTKDGLPGSMLRELNFDRSGRLWTISREALLCIEPGTKRVTQLKPEITFSFNDHWNSLLKVGDDLYATMLDHVVIINTRKFQQLPKLVSPLITSIRVFQNEKPVNPGIPLKLTYRENFFSIDFSSPFHREYSSIQYAYKLDGFDKDWVYSSRNHTASYTNVPDGSYTFRVKSSDGSNQWMEKETVMNIFVSAPFWKRWWFISLVVLFIIVLLAWWYRIRVVRRRDEIRFLEINKLLAESQLMALRAQMNPHFVFNCLNSIQECIVTQKYGEASKYLNKFSKLFRLVLNNSGKNLVTLNEEREVLELYLELEQMRFEKSFTYSIIMDEDLESDDVLVPSMLLQPYVENALWHGLMHKEGDRKLVISFEKITDEIFRCTIDDNGIGRNRSFELKEKQSKAKRHESKGLKISQDRINLIREQGNHATLQIIDKPGDSGTTVLVELSMFLKN